MTITASMYGYSLSSWSVWARYASVVPSETTIPNATHRWSRTRISSWNIQRNPHMQATSTSFSLA